jgi:hypothetical protein
MARASKRQLPSCDVDSNGRGAGAARHKRVAFTDALRSTLFGSNASRRKTVAVDFWLGLAFYAKTPVRVAPGTRALFCDVPEKKWADWANFKREA